MKYLIPYLGLTLLISACNMSGDVRTSAKKLRDSAIALTNEYQDTAKFEEAIALLEKAIKIDSTNFYYYRDKYFFESCLRRSDLALKTIGYLLKFKPDSAELYFHAGVLQTINKDTLLAENSFKKAAILFKLTLDTMDRKSPYFFYDWRLWAASMIMINEGDIIHHFLKENCTTPMDSSIYYPETLSKSKDELIQMMIMQYSH